MADAEDPLSRQPPAVGGAQPGTRLADRVTNICERTVFVVTGELLEFDRTDDEDA